MTRKSPARGLRLGLRGAIVALLASSLHTACSAAGTSGFECPVDSDLQARPMAAPFCVHLEVVQDSCACEGTVWITNDCRFEVTASDFVFDDDDDTILPGETRSFHVSELPEVVISEQAFTLQADSEEFAIVTHCGW